MPNVEKPLKTKEQLPVEPLREQELWDRARSSVFELLKFSIGLSTAIFSLLFVALTEGSRATGGRKVALAAMLLVALAALAGLAGWAADAYWYSARARYRAAFDKDDIPEANEWLERRNRNARVRKIALRLAGAVFALGVAAALYYAYLRL
jgi:hypothetical protein